MNMLSNNFLPQLDEAALYSPLAVFAATVTQAAIDEGVQRARRLRARAFLGALRRLTGLLRR